MSDFEELQKQIERMTAPIRRVQEAVDRSVPSYIKQLNQTVLPIIQQHERMLKAVQPMLDHINRVSDAYERAAKRWENEVRQDLELMAERGWYPNWFTFDFYSESAEMDADELMEAHLEHDWERIREKVLDLYPNRYHVLNTAFSLHSDGNYTASIPLFFAQADGICCEVFKSFLFTGNDVNEKVEELIRNGNIKSDLFAEVFLELFIVKNHHNSGISKTSAKTKEKAPNRNGILHGHWKHLDYGTKRNSMKVFSLLSFVIFSSSEFIET